MTDIDVLIKFARKIQNKKEENAYKNVKAKIQEYKTAKNAKPFDDEAYAGIIMSMVKQLKKALETIPGSSDLAQEYREEVKIISGLLPPPATPEMVKLALFEKYQDFGEIKIPKSEMGNAIKFLKDKFPYNEKSEISKIVKEFVIC